MPKHSKRFNELVKKNLEEGKIYPVEETFVKVKACQRPNLTKLLMLPFAPVLTLSMPSAITRERGSSSWRG